MTTTEPSLALLGAVLLLGLLSPLLLARFQLPMASTLLLVGAVVGPHGLDWVQPGATLTTFAFLGAAFQMFLSGLEAHDLDLSLRDRGQLTLVATAGLTPALVGCLVPLLFGYSWTQAAFVGATQLSASILLVFALAHHHDPDGLLGRRARGLAVTLDLASAFAVFALLQFEAPHERFPLPILLGLVFVSVAALRMYVPELAEFAFARLERTPSRGEERHVRFTLALMLGVIFAYATLDVPAFLAAFLAGVALAPVQAAPQVREKLELVGHALFIPVFLVSIGLDTDLGLLLRWESGNLLVVLLVLGTITARLAGSYVGGLRIGLPHRRAGLLALITSPRLSVALTATYAGHQVGLLDATLLTAVVLVSLLTSVVAPLLATLPWWRGDEGSAGEASP